MNTYRSLRLNASVDNLSSSLTKQKLKVVTIAKKKKLSSAVSYKN